MKGRQPRSRWLRFDTAQTLKRFFFMERSILTTQAAWLPVIEPFEIKVQLPRIIWQNAQTAGALRDRIFELKFPSRTVEEEGSDRVLISALDQLRFAPSLSAFLLTIANIVLPKMHEAYRLYLQTSDPIADGPSHRFLNLALQEKESQLAKFHIWAEKAIAESPSERDTANAWVREFLDRVVAADEMAGSPSTGGGEVLPIPGSRVYAIPNKPGRDPRFWPCRFYWPDIVDSSYSYGEGTTLQLRSAISHLNEIWAIENGGLILSAFAPVLPWDWIHDAARWTYDESRHCQMGYDRLISWGLGPAEIPLGTYIYDSATGHDVIYRLGMLYFFETKNIRHKLKRAQIFHEYGDKLSEHDMDFDWADETIHASYGKKWLTEILSIRGQDAAERERVRERCQVLIQQCVASATRQEIQAIKSTAENLIGRLA